MKVGISPTGRSIAFESLDAKEIRRNALVMREGLDIVVRQRKVPQVKNCFFTAILPAFPAKNFLTWPVEWLIGRSVWDFENIQVCIMQYFFI